MANSKRKCKNCGVRVRNYIVLNNVAYCSFESAIQWANKNKSKGADIVHKKKRRFTMKIKYQLEKEPQKKLVTNIFGSEIKVSHVFAVVSL